MNAWDATTYEGEKTILRVVRGEAARLTDLAARPGPGRPRPRARAGPCDVVGHLGDTAEGHFEAFEAARFGAEATPYGLAGMLKRAGQQATRLIAGRYLNLFFRI